MSTTEEPSDEKHSDASERHTLFVTDAEMIRRMGVPEKIARDAIRALDKNKISGFPQKQALWGGRRFWPAVVQWFDRANGLLASPAPRGRQYP